MTALPPWVMAGLKVLDGGLDNLTSSDLASRVPSDRTGDLRRSTLADKSGLSAPSFPAVLRRPVWHPNGFCFDMSTLVYTSTSKGAPWKPWEVPYGPLVSPFTRYPEHRAWKTCRQCPQPLYEPSVFGFTKRCTSCNTQAMRFRRAIARGDRIDVAQRYLKKSTRWVTLTVPNYSDPIEGLAHMKKLFRNFRQTREFQKRVSGTLDFWEWTVSSSDGDSIPPAGSGGDNESSPASPQSFNVHYHGLWVGDYWKHSDLLKSWGHGGARISSVGSRRKRLNYCISYAKKQDALGIRAQQLTGCLYGRAYVEIESALKQAVELSNADVVQD